jgi:membrane associated rhomboid family serine protease
VGVLPRAGPRVDLEAFIQVWGFVPARYFLLAATAPGEWADRYVPLFSSMFLHGGWAHLIGNMIYLWIFGDNVEDRLGHLRYLVFYLLSGVAAALAQAYLFPDSTIPTVGASGAISGVLGAFLVLFPTARVFTLVPLLLFFPVVELPAVLYLGFWFLMQLMSGTVSLTVVSDAGGGRVVGACRRLRGRPRCGAPVAPATELPPRLAGSIRTVVGAAQAAQEEGTGHG